VIKMPWDNSSAPNLMLEITDACNIDCRVCYKKKGDTVKSISQIQSELATAMKLRTLHTITVSGGEPTLHPHLDKIVEIIKKQDVHVFLLTNGVSITIDYLKKLKQSGLDSILFHVDEGQNRPDISYPPTFKDIKKRLQELVLLARSLDIDVSISVTLYPDKKEMLHNFAIGLRMIR
jgi:MoaA/NifB/PqqE/SkfB family radical SAM enzyme